MLKSINMWKRWCAMRSTPPYQKKEIRRCTSSWYCPGAVLWLTGGGRGVIIIILAFLWPAKGKEERGGNLEKGDDLGEERIEEDVTGGGGGCSVFCRYKWYSGKGNKMVQWRGRGVSENANKKCQLRGVGSLKSLLRVINAR